MQARSGALAAAVAVAVVAAACGGGGGERLTKEEYVAQADAICAKANEQEDALGDVPSDPAGLAGYLEQEKAIGEEQVTSLRALEPPEELQAQVEQAYDLLDQVLAKLDEAIAAAKAGDIEQLTAIGAEAQRLATQADQIAQEIGLTVCGQT